jgi:hypothetical protein
LVESVIYDYSIDKLGRYTKEERGIIAKSYLENGDSWSETANKRRRVFPLLSSCHHDYVIFLLSSGHHDYVIFFGVL